MKTASTLAVIVLTVWTFSAPSGADVVTLRDGTILDCKILEQRTIEGTRFDEIEVSGSRLLLRSEWVTKRSKEETTPVPTSGRDVLAELLRQGKILPSIRSQLGLKQNAPQTNVATDLQVGEIRGWGYGVVIVQGRAVRGAALSVSDVIPDGGGVDVMANSRVRLDLPKVASLCLSPGAQVVVEESRFDQEVFNYRLSLQVDRQFLVLKTHKLPAPRKLKLITEGVYFYSREGSVGIVRDDEGRLRLYPLDKPITLSTSLTAPGRHERIEPGQVYIATGTGTGSVEKTDAAGLVAFMAEWDAWQPEDLALQWKIPLPALPIGDAWPTEPLVLPSEIEIITDLAVPFPQETMGESMQAWREGLDAFRKDVGRYPTEEEGLAALRGNPGVEGWNGPYADDTLSNQDIWGNEFVYARIKNGETVYPDVRSKGADGRDDRGLDDDLR